MSVDYNQAWAYVAAIAGDPTTAIIDFRAISDTDKTVPAIPLRGTLPDMWSAITAWNDAGYGIFATVAAMDGHGRELSNVWYIRANYIDCDTLSAEQNMQAANAWSPPASFAVQSSPGKYHVYFVVAPYQGNDRFQVMQRKLRQMYDGDRQVIDAARVMRLPGTYHRKGAPHLVTCFSLAGYGQPLTIETLEAATAHINIIDTGGGRHELGDPDLAAPSIEWLDRALELTDPNALDRGEWIAITSAVKQAGWTLADPDTLFMKWSAWCARYDKNDTGENLKQWNSIRNTELGWKSLVSRVPSLKALVAFNGSPATVPTDAPPVPGAPPVAPVPPLPATGPAPLDCSGSILTHLEQQHWFKGCVFVVNIGEMMTPNGRLLNVSQFNVAYGGKQFIIDDNGKLTNEAWAAATRSTLWTVPKVDHLRFLPSEAYASVITDDLGRDGINTYKPAHIKRVIGDVAPFLRHMQAMFPVAGDVTTLIEYFAHNAQYPGFKIPWAPVIQSAEGAGKGVIKRIMAHVIGRPYTYFPNAKQLGESGSQFNAWMRNKLFIVADEIKVDDRRDMIEVLKPMLSEIYIEIQGKGHDQEIEDNPANWCFFSNWKDAIPTNKNGRRFCVMFSALQTVDDLIARGMDDAYFNALYSWLDADGAAIVAEYLMTYPIARGSLPMRAPVTSSTGAALSLSRGPLERMVQEAVADELPGFRGGWVSVLAVTKRVKDTGALTRPPAAQTVETMLGEMGYVACGRADRAYFQEDPNIRPQLYHLAVAGDVSLYAAAQGWSG